MSDCRGTAVWEGRCLIHLGPKTEEIVAELTRRGVPLDVSGCRAGALDRVFAALPMDGQVPFCKGLRATELEGERNLYLAKPGAGPVRVEGDLEISASILRGVHLHAAHVTGSCHFDQLSCQSLGAAELTCEGEVSSQGLRTTGDLNLARSRIGAISLRELNVGGTTNLADITAQRVQIAGALRGLATFNSSDIGAELDLSGAVLSDHLTLFEASVGGSVALGGGELPSLDMRGSTVNGRLLTATLSIVGKADFGAASIGGLSCTRTHFLGQTNFSEAVIAGAHSDLSGVVAELRVDVTVISDTVDLTGAHFRDGLDLRLGDSAVRLDGTRFDAPSLVSGSPLEHASVISIAEARLRNLALSHIDLSNCLMEGAAELDQLKLGDGVRFPRAPLAIVGHWGARGRQVIANDVEWRQRAHPHSVWTAIDPPAAAHPDALRKSRASLPAPPEIEELYRSLRTAREQSGNSPGAASFYYGEMEMRRMRPWSSSWDEKAIVWLYWAISGYGLRASRALVALAVFWALGVFYFLHLGGFLNHPPLADTIVFTASSGLSFLHEPPNNLTVTTGGEAAQLLLRIGTAVLLALATLALRGRVKR